MGINVSGAESDSDSCSDGDDVRVTNCSRSHPTQTHLTLLQSPIPLAPTPLHTDMPHSAAQSSIPLAPTPLHTDVPHPHTQLPIPLGPTPPHTDMPHPHAQLPIPLAPMASCNKIRHHSDVDVRLPHVDVRLSDVDVKAETSTWKARR